MTAATLPTVQGKLTPNAPLAPLVWFKSGGAAEWLFEPKDLADLQGFLRDLDPAVPLMAMAACRAWWCGWARPLPRSAAAPT